MVLTIGIIALLALTIGTWSFFRAGNAVDMSLKSLQTTQKSSQSSLDVASSFEALISSMTAMQTEIQMIQVEQAKIPNTEPRESDRPSQQFRKAVRELDLDVNRIWHSIKALKKRMKALESLKGVQDIIREDQAPAIPGQDSLTEQEKLDKQDYYQEPSK
jgi:hypothetical protein